MVVLIVLLILVAASAAVAGALLARRRSRLLRRRFGPEYLRLLMESGDHRGAERELARRLRRYRSLRPRALNEDERSEFAGEWARLQEGFVDGPAEAVQGAEQLLARIAARRGFPDLGPQRRLADLSVDYPHGVAHYRAALELRAEQEGPPSTEDLRRALVRYRDFLSTVLAGASEAAAQGIAPASVPIEAAGD